MITKSTILEDRVGPDGRRKIVEQHMRDDGPDVLVRYLAEENLDVGQRMVDRVPELEAQLVAEVAADAAGEALASAEAKSLSFAADQSDAQLKSAGMTDEEIVVLKEKHG